MQVVASEHGKPAGMYEHISLVEIQGEDDIELEYRFVGASSCHKSLAAPASVSKMQLLVIAGDCAHGKPAKM